ncbi:hypothetical protein FQN57_005437 [Myotisia sp. PD_48]|nr:hypothetical protein FQN57_005437 [Myotisia sp. PD_48]
MDNYTALKVTELKDELKKRGIPQTGLRLKKQLIDRLIEDDNSRGAPAPTKPEAEPEREPEREPEQYATEQSDAGDTGAELRAPAQAEQQPSSTPSELPKPAEAEPVRLAAQDAPSVAASNTSDSTVQESAPAPRVAPSEQAPPAASEPAVEAATKPEAAPVTDAVPKDIGSPKRDSAQDLSSSRASAEVDTSKEDIDDSKKRKRRSQSPPPSERSIALKKSRAEDGQPRVILKEDGAEETKKLEEQEASKPDLDIEMDVDSVSVVNEKATGQTEPSALEPDREPELPSARTTTQQEEVQQGESPQKTEQQRTQRRSVADARFKDLFPATNGAPMRQESPPPFEDGDRVVEPALHPATTALYIRNFMRPLQPTPLKRHLYSLATAPNASPNPDIIVDFFLDSIKTHCFASFTSIAAASRVRTALHGATWPEERNRKPLWVDFVPEEKLKQWIDIEQAPGHGGRGPQRWEVAYDKTDDGVTVTLQEATANNHAPGRASFDNNMSANLGREPPTGPRADRVGGPGQSSNIPERGFQALDDRFSSTVTKPKLYYLPASQEVADRRLDRFDDLIKAGPSSKRGGDEMFRYTFEDGDFFVEQGPEYGSRRPGGGRGRGAVGRESWRGGWREGSWRGRR